jgi:hypothetical protein
MPISKDEGRLQSLTMVERRMYHLEIRNRGKETLGVAWRLTPLADLAGDSFQQGLSKAVGFKH